ncbi:MAG: MFS transporter [Lentisphaeria bacterium]|nr:MFS transporter [Lentisphaeria bacterium]
MRRRWLILAAGCLIQTILGGIYAWSTFVPYLMKTHDLTAGQCGFIFGVTILTFTVSMIAAGRLLTRKGPRLTASVAACLFMSGYLLASVSGDSFPVLLLGVGVIAGAGIGFGYVCPLSVGMKWFPHKKGLVTGVVVAGFGGGAVLLATVAEYLLIEGMDVLVFFRWFGVCSGAVLFLAASVLADPPSSGTGTQAFQAAAGAFTWPFFLIATGMFAGTFAGLLIIGNLAPMVIKAGLTEGQAAVSISVFAVGNAAGRIAWGHAFDGIGHKTMPLSLGGFALTAGLLLTPLPVWGLFLCVGLLGFGFGANFVVYASAISRHFGASAFPRLYPWCFLAYGVAGLIGPGVGGYLADVTASYTVPLYICVALVAAAASLLIINGHAFKRSAASLSGIRADTP